MSLFVKVVEGNRFEIGPTLRMGEEEEATTKGRQKGEGKMCETNSVVVLTVRTI